MVRSFAAARDCQNKHERVRGRRQVAKRGGRGPQQMAVLAVLVLFETRREYLVEMDQLMHRVDDK